MCLEIGTLETGLTKREQLIFYSDFGESKIDKVLVGKKDGTTLYKYQAWCHHPSTNDADLLLNTVDTGITLINEGNSVDLATKTAKVEFKRPLVVQASETMDLQATYRGFEYKIYLSYSY